MPCKICQNQKYKTCLIHKHGVHLAFDQSDTTEKMP